MAGGKLSWLKIIIAVDFSFIVNIMVSISHGVM